MIKEQEFKEIIEKSKRFSNSSMYYIITFIPKEWVKDLEEVGFKVRNAWHDYFVYDLSEIDVDSSDDFDFLTVENSKEASDLTMMCRNNSRGFTGQTPQWIEKWITGEEDSAVETGAKHNNILIERNEDKSLAGILCTATYGEEDKCTLWVRELAVNPECRNKGIGRKLLMKAFAYGKKHGAKKSIPCS